MLGLLPYFESRSSQPNVTLVVASDDETGEAVGSLQVCDNVGKFRSEAARHRAEISCFFVGEQARGLGVGYGLMRKAEEVARGMGVDKITLDCRESQKDAIRLYERFGFRRYGTMERYASLDGLVFQRGFYYDKDL